jgi:hypothetical protein
MHLLKIEVDGHSKVSGSALLSTDKGFNLWLDFWQEDGELCIEWNKYIFNLNCSQDMRERKFQYNSDNFMRAFETLKDSSEYQTIKAHKSS